MANLENAPEAFDLFQEGGQISAENLGVALRSLGCTPSDEEISEMSAGKGCDLAEFQKHAASIASPSHDDVLEAFSVFDTAGQGFVNINELTHLMKALGEGLTDEQIAGLTKVAAADADNQVNVRHLVDTLMRAV